MRKKTLFTITLAILLTITANFLQPAYSQILVLRVKTNKEAYNVGELISITGNVTLDGVPVTDALVAIQINDRSFPFAYRTVNTGTTPSGPWKIELINTFIGDLAGNPATTIIRGYSYYIWIIYRNNEDYAIHTSFTYTIYDSSNAAISTLAPLSTNIMPGGPFSIASEWTVPDNAQTGFTTVYACAFTNYPQTGGSPHCPEKSYTVNMISSTAIDYSTQDASITQIGNFTTRLRVPTKDARLGNYTVYVASFYNGYPGFRSTSFEIKLFGDINGDGYVNAKDATKLGVAFGSSEGDPLWNPNADINKDGIVNAKDAIIVGNNFGHSGIPAL